MQPYNRAVGRSHFELWVSESSLEKTVRERRLPKDLKYKQLRVIAALS